MNSKKSLFILLVLCLGVAKNNNVSAKQQEDTTVQAEAALEKPNKKTFVGNVVDFVSHPFANNMFKSLKELLVKFENAFGKLADMALSFFGWITDLFKTFESVAADTQTRYTQVDATVQELVQLSQKIERRCRNPKDEATRSLCIDNEVEVNNKLQAAREQRSQLRKKYEAYEPFLKKKGVMSKLSE